MEIVNTIQKSIEEKSAEIFVKPPAKAFFKVQEDFPAAAVQRYIYTFDGVDDFASFTQVALPGDFTIRFKTFNRGTTGERVYIGRAGSNNSFMSINNTTLSINIEGLAKSFAGAPANKIIDVEFKRVGVNITVTVDGTSLGTQSSTGATYLLDNIGRRFAGSFLNTAIWDVEIIDDTDLGSLHNRFYVIDDNSSTLVDSVNNQDATINNSTPEFWELFEKNGVDWLSTQERWDTTNPVVVGQVPINTQVVSASNLPVGRSIISKVGASNVPVGTDLDLRSGGIPIITITTNGVQETSGITSSISLDLVERAADFGSEGATIQITVKRILKGG